ncbi:tetratricopeptide repeat protein [Paludisphaera mucosa]|uniref:Tetratricopeptide repeat protein n=1 Tax=Paludisphaera mucosa TaxID=3030827 RepID=A0ABT6FKI4_9BACT|nr:tetratricopeptide repeat protein [Paludisphaera mucosa]MDG3008021.1 tetratricopeptide repeat protein [Paludisphaera mucosa]
MRRIVFTHHPPRCDRRHLVTEAEVRVVLGRLPERLWERLAAVHFNDRSRGGRLLGYVGRMRDEISLCALPPRVSLAAFLTRSQSPTRFGAVRGCQWPALAVRRFLLYDVLLHELGHLQVVDGRARKTRRRFASETRAQEFAESWCREVWSRPFDHPDPVHNPAPAEEIAALRGGWRDSHGHYKQGLVREKARRYEEAAAMLVRAVGRYPGHARALERLGVLTYAGKGTAQSTVGAIEILDAAVRREPTLLDATLFLGMALSREGREAEARSCFERAMLLDAYGIAIATYADALADWGRFAEAEALFRKALRRNPRSVLAIRDYGRCLMDARDPGADDVGRAIVLFERALALDPTDDASHYLLGRSLLLVDGEQGRAIEHLERALQIRPAHEGAAERLAEIAAGRDDPREG